MRFVAVAALFFMSSANASIGHEEAVPIDEWDACFNLNHNKVNLRASEIDSESRYLLTLTCYSTPAKTLFEKLGFQTEKTWHYEADVETRYNRTNTDWYNQYRCHHDVPNNAYWCHSFLYIPEGYAQIVRFGFDQNVNERHKYPRYQEFYDALYSCIKASGRDQRYMVRTEGREKEKKKNKEKEDYRDIEKGDDGDTGYACTGSVAESLYNEFATAIKSDLPKSGHNNTFDENPFGFDDEQDEDKQKKKAEKKSERYGEEVDNRLMLQFNRNIQPFFSKGPHSLCERIKVEEKDKEIFYRYECMVGAPNSVWVEDKNRPDKDESNRYRKPRNR
jgi:hypothetical protein